MNNDEIDYTVEGKVSKLDKWKFNDTLNILARNAYFTKGTPMFSHWVDRFVTALKPVNTKKLPLKEKIKKADRYLSNKYYWEKCDRLKENYEIWYDPIKRDLYLEKWEEQYWEHLFDYAMELATSAGFTIYLVQYEPKTGGGGVGFDDQIPISEA